MKEKNFKKLITGEDGGGVVGRAEAPLYTPYLCV